MTVHYHMCPCCFRHVKCEMDCSPVAVASKYDISEHNGSPVARQAVCSECADGPPERDDDHDDWSEDFKVFHE